MASTPRRRVTYGGVGRCIYCGSTGDLREEHIIPLSLGGEFVMLDASCGRCADITSAFEGLCARGIYKELRIFNDYPTRRPRERPTHLPLTIEHGGKREERMVPVEEYPGGPLFAPLFPVPGILTGTAPTEQLERLEYEIYMPQIPDQIERLQRLRGDGPTQVHVPINWGLNPFMRMLAKIGHGFATMVYRDLFVPVLPPYILDADTRLFYVIGGTEQKIEMAAAEQTGRLHHHAFRVGIRQYPDGRKYATVILQMFRYLGMPTYEIVAGPISAENAREALSRPPPNSIQD